MGQGVSNLSLQDVVFKCISLYICIMSVQHDLTSRRRRAAESYGVYRCVVAQGAEVIPAHQIVCIVGFPGFHLGARALESDGRIRTVRKISVVVWKCFVRRTIAVYASRFYRAYSTGLFSGG